MDSWNFIKVVLAVLFLQDKSWSHDGNLLSDAWLPNFGYKRHNSHPISRSFPPAEEALATATAHPHVNCTLTNWTGTCPEVSQDHTLASQVLPFPARQATLGSLPTPQAPFTWMHSKMFSIKNDSKMFSYSPCLCWSLTRMHFKFNMLKSELFFSTNPSHPKHSPSPLSSTSLLCVDTDPLSQGPAQSLLTAVLYVFSLSYTGFSQNCLKTNLLKIKSSLKYPLSAQPH